MKKWAERAAIITGTIGIAGACIILSETLQQQTSTTTSITAPVNTPGRQQLPDDKRLDTLKPANNEVVKTNIEQKHETDDKNVVVKKRATTKAPEVKPEKRSERNRSLNREELDDLYNAIARRMADYKSMNCVQIHTLQRSNNEKAAAQVERFLQQKGLVLTGRELVEKCRNGIYIKTRGACTVVTIGKL